MICPYCNHEMTCDEVDIGVGIQQSGPYGCEWCYAVEIGPERYPGNPEFEATLDEDERKTGVYKGDRKWPVT